MNISSHYDIYPVRTQDKNGRLNNAQTSRGLTGLSWLVYTIRSPDIRELDMVEGCNTSERQNQDGVKRDWVAEADFYITPHCRCHVFPDEAKSARSSPSSCISATREYICWKRSGVEEENDDEILEDDSRTLTMIELQLCQLTVNKVRGDDDWSSERHSSIQLPQPAS